MNFKEKFLNVCASGFIISALLFLSACSTLPVDVKKTPSYSQSPIEDSRLTRRVAQLLQTHPGQTGVSVLRTGIDAFLARALLAEKAQQSLDLQYYIWENDLTGKLLTAQILEAADRGVRVRLLIDDFNTVGLDPFIQSLNQHEQIEIRLYNPFVNRSNRIWNLLTDLSRLNRRMHNKMFIADSKVVIVGGRNIGDEYFQASPSIEFNDVDVVAIGPVLKQATESFDHYWNSSVAFPAESILKENSNPLSLDELRQQLQTFSQQQKESEYAEVLRQTEIFQDPFQPNLEWYWGDAELLYDVTEKTTNKKASDLGLVGKLAEELDNTQKEFIIVSPYFVPTEKLFEYFEKLKRQNTNVIILTNSLASTDVSIVHAGYQQYRKRLLRLGINLYELKPGKNAWNKKKFMDLTDNARSSLHAKAYIFDQQKLFVGSLNADPRSVHINTENGLLIENSGLAKKSSTNIQAVLPEYAYKLEIRPGTSDLQPQDRIVWLEHDGEKTVTHDIEPLTNPLQTLMAFLLSLLPIEDQL